MQFITCLKYTELFTFKFLFEHECIVNRNMVLPPTNILCFNLSNGHYHCSFDLLIYFSDIKSCKLSCSPNEDHRLTTTKTNENTKSAPSGKGATPPPWMSSILYSSYIFF